MRVFSLFLFAVSLTFGAFATGAQAADITVSAAASLTNAFTEVKAAFEAKYPDIKVTTNFAASNPLLKQIEEGAPVDVFASADQATMDRAQNGNLIDVSSRVNFALNDLVLITPADNPAKITGVADLTGNAVQRLAIGNPDSVPAGRYAREALSSARLWDSLQSKYIMGESVRQVLDYVSRGEVHAGFVYRTDALQAGDKVKIIAVATGHTPVSYPISAIKTTGDAASAATFIGFVTSPEGQAILAKYGFSSPK